MNYLHISKNRALQNLQFFKSFGKEITVMVKANAYGHGIDEIAKILKNENVKLGVATLDEAKELKKNWNKEILIVEPILDFSQVENFQLVVDTIEGLKMAINLGANQNCYLKINVGMNRFGISCNDKKMLKNAVKTLKKHKIRGILAHFSHLSSQEETKKQYDNFVKVKKIFRDLDLSISFGGTDCYIYDFDFNELRVGIGFYGYGNENLKPVMTFDSQILKIFELKKGDKLGYDGEFQAEKNMKVGIVGVGYGDGIDRKTTGLKINVNGCMCEIIGKICMDCLFVDLSGVKANIGDRVTIFDDAQKVADYLKTIPYEILTRCTNVRGKRVIES